MGPPYNFDKDVFEMKYYKKMLCAALAAAAALGNSSALAANVTGRADFWVCPMFVEGMQVYSWTPDGQENEYLSYKGTIYVQLRTVAEWMGKEVNWDGGTKTIALSGSVAPVYHDRAGSGKEKSTEAYDQWIAAGAAVTERPDITVTLDGTVQSLKDASGKPVCPIAYNGTNYLPLRAVAELSGMTVKYQGKDSASGREAVFLKSAREGSEMDAYKAYVDTLSKQNIFPGMTTEALDSIDACRQQVQRCKAAMETLKSAPKPEGGLLDQYYEKMCLRADEAIAVCDAALEKIDAGASLEEANTLLHVSQATLGGSISVVDACRAPFAYVTSMKMVVEESYGS